MLSKNEIKYIQSLGHKKQRDEYGVFVAEGPKLAAELLQSQANIVTIYALALWKEANSHHNVTEVSPKELERISQLKTPHEVVVIVNQFPWPASFAFINEITLCLDGIQDPGNMGTLVRIADWFGISQILCSSDCADIYNPKVVQASMGSIARVQIKYTDLSHELQQVPVPVYGALLQGKNVYDNGRIKEGIIVIGNEGKGISDTIKNFITNPITIPAQGHAESLNAAVAAGIILSHITM